MFCCISQIYHTLVFPMDLLINNVVSNTLSPYPYVITVTTSNDKSVKDSKQKNKNTITYEVNSCSQPQR